MFGRAAMSVDGIPATICVVTFLAGCGGEDPVAPTGGTFALESVSAGTVHTCGLDASGRVYCWGESRAGQVGRTPLADCNDVPGEAPCSLDPVRLETSLRFEDVQVGGASSCAITGGGKVYCWGSNELGQLGRQVAGDRCGPKSIPCSISPLEVGGGFFFETLSVGSVHVCAISSQDLAYCWGYNQGGRLGNGSTTQSSRPVRVAGGLQFRSVVAGGTHTCGITESGETYCWGYNHLGQLGHGTTTARAVPQRVASGVRFEQLALGTAHSCATAALGEVYCWGSNVSGAVGPISRSDSCDGSPCLMSPRLLSAAENLGRLTAGGGFTCGLDQSTAAAYCWGENRDGQLGNGDTTATDSPARVGGGMRVNQVSAGFDYACGVALGGSAYCWGTNYQGRLGNGESRGVHTAPVAVTDPGL